ncbi:hypothetical protein JTB14_005694 [Gonioctena quinquepunctata]|nr:hypothetical protein JTB14_005694 [Gonioctena quinquepunctata]
MEIQKRKTIDKISYPEARKIVASTYRQPENSYANAVRSTSPIDINSLVSRLVPEIEKIVNEIVNNKNNQTKVFLAPTTTAPRRNTSQEPQKLDATLSESSILSEKRKRNTTSQINLETTESDDNESEFEGRKTKRKPGWKKGVPRKKDGNKSTDLP